MDRRSWQINEDAKNGIINPMNDAFFKFLLGKEESKRLTIDFLNAVLGAELHEKIEDVTFLPTENSPERVGGKETRFDIACELDSKRRVDIEVQVLDQHDMKRRTLVYWSQFFLRDLGRGTKYSDLSSVFTINILDFELFPNTSSPVSAWGICNLATHERLSQDLGLFFLEIPKFEKLSLSGRQLTPVERWMCFFSRRMSMEMKRHLISEDEIMQEALKRTDRFMSDELAWKRYIDTEIARLDFNSMVEGVREKSLEEGIEQGIEQGIEKGREEEKKETQNTVIPSLLKKGFPPKDLAESFSLSLEQIFDIARANGIDVSYAR